MTDRQVSRLSMYFALREYLTAYTEIIKSLPYYMENMTLFTETITQIQLMAEQQSISRKGVTEHKRQLKEALVTTIADYSRKLTAYARFSNDPVLEQEVKFTEGRLRKKSDSVVRDYGQIVYDRAQKYLSNLDIYGITAQDQTALAKAILDFNSTIGKPRLSRIEGSQITSELKRLFQTADMAMANMDTAVEIVRLAQKGFYLGYRHVRKVIVSGRRRLALKCLVTDALSGEPVKGVTLSFAPDGSDTLKTAKTSKDTLVKKTAEKGGFHIKSLGSGVYRVSLKKVGYAGYSATVAVADGEMTDLRFRISRD